MAYGLTEHPRLFFFSRASRPAPNHRTADADATRRFENGGRPAKYCTLRARCTCLSGRLRYPRIAAKSVRFPETITEAI